MDTMMIIWGEPKRPIEDTLGLDPNNCTYIERLGELAEEAIDWDEEYILNLLIEHSKAGVKLYIATTPNTNERAILDKFLELRPYAIIDEAFEIVRVQVGGECNDPVAFEDAYLQACEDNATDGQVVFGFSDEPNVATFWAPNRPASPHTVKWCDDGTIEVDGCILRLAAIVGVGNYIQETIVPNDLGPIRGVLQPNQVAAFIARRLATNGVNDLLGYGRAFGPGREDHTNATLTTRGREFRSKGVVGVVSASAERISKAKPERVIEVAEAVRRLNDAMFVLPHQQGREFYVGDAALEAFRGEMSMNAKGDLLVTLFGKSAKHVRVDAGAYCLYTKSGTGLIRIPVIIGMFEESNGGCVFAPRGLMDGVLIGHLKETVRAVKDHASMPDELVSRYYTTDMLVTEGERVEPGATMFRVDDIDHVWHTKADYGIVTKIVDVATSNLVRCEVHIDAYFVGDAKLRGPIKAMVAPLEASGMEIEVKRNGILDTTPRFVIGAPGAIKDSAAFKAYLHDAEPCFAALTTQYCKRDLERSMQKHAPLEDGPCDLKLRTYDNCGVTLIFDDTNRTVTTQDPHAIIGYLDVMIEASPVAQSVGNSAMTLPQLAWLSAMPAGNDWLEHNVLPGIIKRTRALGYMHAVAGNVEHATLTHTHTEE